jgi:hypothetical protein
MKMKRILSVFVVGVICGFSVEAEGSGTDCWKN